MRTQMAAITLVFGVLASVASAQETKVAAVGPQYAAGGMQRFWFGKGYRDLWTTPVEVPVLDLQTTGGGLTPVRVVGQAQGLGLAIQAGRTGRAYTFRSLHKHPERMLPEKWRDRCPAKIAQDQSSHTHPAAGSIQAALARAAGVAATNPRLVVMPDDPALGEFRKTFANEFGTIDEFPLAGRRRTARLHGRDRDRLERRPVEPVARRARRTASTAGPSCAPASSTCGSTTTTATAGSGGGCGSPASELWQPLPEDPDMVLVRHDGLVSRGFAAASRSFLKFSREVPGQARGAPEQASRSTAGCSRTSTRPPGRRSRRTSSAGSPMT